MKVKNKFTEIEYDYEFRTWNNQVKNKDSYVVIDWGDLVMTRQIENGNLYKDVFIMDRSHAKRMIELSPNKFNYRELSSSDWIELRNSVSPIQEKQPHVTKERINHSSQQVSQPFKTRNEKLTTSFWKKPPSMAWQIIGVVVAVILAVVVILANKGII